MNEVAATIDDRRCKAGKVADDAPAKCQEMIRTLDPKIEQPIDNGLEAGPALALFTCRRTSSGTSSTLLRAVRIFRPAERPDILVADDEKPACRAQRGSSIFC